MKLHKFFETCAAVLLVAAAVCQTGCIGSMREKRKAERIEQDVAYRNEQGIYRVGDSYDLHGTCGIVFEIDSTGRHGKIVSLQEKKLVWDVEMRIVWPDYYGLETGAESETDGAGNCSKIAAIGDWQRKYPAFAYCLEAGEGWYLPAYDEMQRLDARREQLDAALGAHNGMPLRSDHYWTSTESSGGTAWQYYMGAANVSGGTHAKNECVAVRPIAAF